MFMRHTAINRLRQTVTALTLLLLASLLAACLHEDKGSDSNDDDSGPSDIRLEQVLTGLSFAKPLLFLQHPGASNIFYVVQQGGIIWRTDLTAGTRTELVDLARYYSLTTCSECGLLGMAFHPNFTANGFIYLSFTEGPNNDSMISRVARFRSADNGQTLAADQSNPATLERTPIFDVAQPFTNHNGGHIAFDSSGFLYLGMGDGGSGNDPQENGQNITTVLGKMLRMNADGTAAAGNVIATQGDPRIYAYGLRNPWRWSFDRQTGELWAGDVGQNAFEEIDIIVNGGNYGWRCREGFEATPGIPPCTLTGGPAIAPVAVYGRSEGVSVTGGYVYRGNAIPGYQGVYIFGDYGSGRIWGLFPAANNSYERRELLDTDLSISSFGEDSAGELYVIGHGGGIHRIVANSNRNT